MVEHAVIVAVLIGGMLACISMAGDATSATFERLMGAGQVPDSYAFSAVPELSEVADDEQMVARLTRQAQMWRLGTLAATIGIGIAFWYGLRLRRKRPEIEEEEVVESECVEPDLLIDKRQGIYGILAADVGKLLHSRLLVRHVMSPRLATVLPSTPRSAVLNIMQEQSVRHLLVCNKNRQLLGVISDRDVLRGNETTAREIMTAKPLTLSPDTPISPAVTLLVNRRISCLPVCDGGELVGVLTTTDMLMVLQCTLQALQKVAAEIGDDMFDGRTGTTMASSLGEPSLSTSQFVGANAT